MPGSTIRSRSPRFPADASRSRSAPTPLRRTPAQLSTRCDFYLPGRSPGQQRDFSASVRLTSSTCFASTAARACAARRCCRAKSRVLALGRLLPMLVSGSFRFCAEQLSAHVHLEFQQRGHLAVRESPPWIEFRVRRCRLARLTPAGAAPPRTASGSPRSVRGPRRSSRPGSSPRFVPPCTDQFVRELRVLSVALISRIRVSRSLDTLRTRRLRLSIGGFPSAS